MTTQNITTDIDKKIEELLNQMTLTEKVGQMNQYNGFWEATGPAPTGGDGKWKYDHLKEGKVGSVLNVQGVGNVRELQRFVVEESRLGIPLLFGYDVIHGHKTLAPIPLAEAASWDLKAIEISARVAAIEASALGINWTFAPMVDISRDARWGRVMEGAGEDPYLGAQIAKARVQGFQGDDLTKPDTIIACAKHFAAYGFAEAGLDYNTADLGTVTLYNVVLPPFKAALDAGVRTFMNAFNVLNSIPATGDPFLQREILKGKWGFEGFVVSDWGSVGEMKVHGFAADQKEAAVRAANAGSDMDMESYAYVDHLEAAVHEGLVDEALIDDAVRRILKVKFDLGLFDDPYRYCDEHREQTLLYHDDHMEAVLDMAKKSIVLLKNDHQRLPLNAEQKGIAVIGQLANDKTSPLGNWRIGSDDGTGVSVLEGLNELGVEYTYERGVEVFSGPVDFTMEINVNETNRDGLDAAVELARNSEVVIMVLGEHGLQSGEGRSRTQLGLPGLQQEMLEAVYAVNQNIILVVMNGRPIVLDWAAQHLPAIVEAWHLGTKSGNAIAEVLTGAYNPSGKLPVSFPKVLGQVPIYYNHLSTGRPNNFEGRVFWSHYIDEDKAPLYPFGFGLSYTTFTYGHPHVEYDGGEEVTVKVTVTNTGHVTGTEITQLYIRDRVASVARPVKELKGFDRFTLAPGESREVVFKLTPAELGFFNGRGEFVVEPGMFDILVGTNSRDLLHAEVDYRVAAIHK